MTGTAQIAANPANAAASTGPRSAKDKARSSRNAEKHGFNLALPRIAWFQDQSTKSTVTDSPLRK